MFMGGIRAGVLCTASKEPVAAVPRADSARARRFLRHAAAWLLYPLTLPQEGMPLKARNFKTEAVRTAQTETSCTPQSARAAAALRKRVYSTFSAAAAGGEEASEEKEAFADTPATADAASDAAANEDISDICTEYVHRGAEASPGASVGILRLIVLLSGTACAEVCSLSGRRKHASGVREAATSHTTKLMRVSLCLSDYPFVAPPRNLVIDASVRKQQQEEQRLQQQLRVAAYTAKHSNSSEARSGSGGKRIYVATELLQEEEPDLVVKGTEMDNNFEVYLDASLQQRVDQEPAAVHTDLLEYDKMYSGLGPWPENAAEEKGMENTVPCRKTVKTIAEAMAEEAKWSEREEQPREEWVLDDDEEALLNTQVRGPSPDNSLFFLDTSYAFANPPSPIGADMGQIDDPLDAPWRRRAEEVIRQVVAYGWPPKVRRSFSGFALLDCSWEQHRLLLPIQQQALPQYETSPRIVTAQDLKRILLMLKHRLQDLADLESLALLEGIDIQVAAVPLPAQQQGCRPRRELLGRRELTMAAGSRVSIHLHSEEAAAAVQTLPPAAAEAALQACARMHAATATAENAPLGRGMLQLLQQQQQQLPQHPLPPIKEDDDRDYIRPIGSCESPPPAATTAARNGRVLSPNAAAAAAGAAVADAAAAAPSYAVAAAANRLPSEAIKPSLSFLKRAVASTRQGRQHDRHALQQECLLLGSPNATCIFFAQGANVYLASLDSIAKVRILTTYS
ncbi:uncharacterized protein LOC34620451 [Cyclospora cayetanensis]|uniref:Uncharacterized protein LOC34620451 n=1 Tax=Cyclospora cayetanensis TaxID=88456 RepID=A0A6P6RSG9_9EIME|nr:uncharacterized protein LOC34620451 [Cyclospora cayetanensis]